MRVETLSIFLRRNINQTEEKYMQQTENMRHNGKMLQSRIEKSHLLQVRIAERMGVNPSTLISFYQRYDLRTNTLWKAAEALNYNFFFDLGMQLPPDMESALNTSLQKRIKELEAENERLKIENGVYEKILKRG